MSTASAYLKRSSLVLLGAAAVFAILAAALLSDSLPTYTVQDGETSLPVTGEFETVGDLLEAAEIDLRPEDVVSPPVIELSNPEVTVKIRRAASVTLRTQHEVLTIRTLEPTLGGFLRQLGTRLKAGEQIFADGSPIPLSELDQTSLPRSVEIGRFVTVSIVDGANSLLMRTSAATVADALEDGGIVVDDVDLVQPDRGLPVSDEMVITITRAFPVTLQADGEQLQLRTTHTKVQRALEEAGIPVSDLDYTIPGNDTVLRPNDLIRLVRVTEDFRTEDLLIPFQTVWQATDALPLDTQALVSSGVDGILRSRSRIRYEDGIEVSSTLDGDWVARDPVNEVVGYGTRIELGTVNTGEGAREYWRVVRMRVTSYTAASSGKQPSDPDYGRTASGVQAGFGVVAIDRNIVPFRSHVYVPGYGIGFAGDTGGGVRGRWIDLGYDEDNFVSWSGYVDVYFLTPIPAPDDINYLLPAAPP